MVRNYFFRLVELFAFEKEEALESMLEYLDPDVRPDWPSLLDDYFDEYDDVMIDADARGPEYFRVKDESSRLWDVVQIVKDPDGDRSFQFHGVVDLDASDEAGEVRLRDLDVVQM